MWQFNKENLYLEQNAALFESNEKNRESKLWYIGQINTVPKCIRMKIEKKYIQFSLEQQDIWPPSHLTQLTIWKGVLDILDILEKIIQKLHGFQRLLNLTNALCEDFKLYQLNLIVNFNQGLAPFRQKRCFGLLEIKDCKNKTMKIFLKSCLMND